MKKGILLTFILMLALSVYAQDEHFKFLGIPLDGSIEEFEAKLCDKGFIREMESRESEINKRNYKGLFAGYDSDVTIEFNPRNRNVYSACVLITRSDPKTILKLYEKFRDDYLQKYPENKYREIDLEDYPSMAMWFNDSSNKKEIGQVTILALPTMYEIFGYCSLTISYTDKANKEKNDNSKLDDL